MRLKHKLNFMNPFISAIINTSEVVKTMTKLDDIRHDLKVLIGEEKEIIFFDESKKLASEQSKDNYSFIMDSYRKEIIKQLK